MNNGNVSLFLPYSSVKKTGRSFAGAKAVLSLSKIFHEYMKSRQFCLARYFFNQTNTSEFRKQAKQRRSAFTNQSNGYVAIVTVLVIGAVMLSVGMAVVLNSINIGQGALAEIKKESGIGFVESCAEDALIKINKNGALAGTIVLPEGTCTVTINSQVGSNWDFTVSGILNGYSKNIRVTATRGSTMTVNSWQEI